MRILYLLRARQNSKLISSVSTNSIRQDLTRTFLTLFALCVAHIFAMVVFENLSVEDSVWLTLTTATTVGYGDMSAETLYGRLSTIILMYAAGIAVLAQAASLYFDYKQSKNDAILNGKWRWTMENHIVFLNAPAREPMNYFMRFMGEFRTSAMVAAQKPAIIVSPDLTDGIDSDLRKLGVTHVNYNITSQEAFTNSNLPTASHIIVMSRDETDPLSDSVTYDLVSRAHAVNPEAIIIAEAVIDDNKDRLFQAGADHVIRPIRSYPELLIRTILAPGAEDIFADLFDTEGEEIVRYNIPVKGEWGDIQCAAIRNDIGTPLAYVNEQGRGVACTNPKEKVEGQALIVLAREGNIKNDSKTAREMAV